MIHSIDWLTASMICSVLLEMIGAFEGSSRKNGARLQHLAPSRRWFGNTLGAPKTDVALGVKGWDALASGKSTVDDLMWPACFAQAIALLTCGFVVRRARQALKEAAKQSVSRKVGAASRDHRQNAAFCKDDPNLCEM